MKNKKFIANPKTRCYICKYALFKGIKKKTSKYGFYVIEGSNKSDTCDYRPGLRALKELKILSPFIMAGLDKQEIRQLARRFHLPNWNVPAAACLASRIPYNRKIDINTLKRVANVEQYLKNMGLTQVRLRDHLPIARIEVLDKDFKSVIMNRKRIIRYLRRAGYKYVTLDLEGYQTGSLNR